MDQAGGDWLIDRPALKMKAGHLDLTRLSSGDVEALVVAVNESLEHLRPWMAWAQTPATPESMARFADDADSAWRQGREFQYVIRRDGSGEVVGGCGLHAREGPGVLEIGYWIHADHLGQGIATGAAAAMTEAAFGLANVERVEIHCVASNVRSAAVPRRLGYRHIAGHVGEAPAVMVWAIGRGWRR